MATDLDGNKVLEKSSEFHAICDAVKGYSICALVWKVLAAMWGCSYDTIYVEDE